MVRRLLSALPLVALLACSSEPKFLYDTDPGLHMADFKTVALDPRELIWTSDGQRPVRSDVVQRQVQAVLASRGLRLVAPEAADLWVNVIAMHPERGSYGKGHGVSPSGGRGGMRSGQGGQGAPISGDRLSSGQAIAGPGAGPGKTSVAYDEFDLSDELTITVRLVHREDGHRVWVGSVFLPAAEKAETVGRRDAVAAVVDQLLQPLPR